MTKEETILKSTEYKALLSRIEKETLWDLAQKYIPSGGSAVEIGVWNGGGSIIIGEVCRQKNAKLFCIDTYGTFSLETVSKNLEGLPIQFIKGDSKNVAQYIKDNSADFIFIDGDHSYPRVKDDMVLYLPKVKNTGFFGGHDYGHSDAGVVKEIADEIFGIDKIELFVKAQKGKEWVKDDDDNSIWRVKL